MPKYDFNADGTAGTSTGIAITAADEDRILYNFSGSAVRVHLEVQSALGVDMQRLSGETRTLSSSSATATETPTFLLAPDEAVVLMIAGAASNNELRVTEDTSVVRGTVRSPGTGHTAARTKVTPAIILSENSRNGQRGAATFRPDSDGGLTDQGFGVSVAANGGTRDFIILNLSGANLSSRYRAAALMDLTFTNGEGVQDFHPGHSTTTQFSENIVAAGGVDLLHVVNNNTSNGNVTFDVIQSPSVSLRESGNPHLTTALLGGRHTIDSTRARGLHVAEY